MRRQEATALVLGTLWVCASAQAGLTVTSDLTIGDGYVYSDVISAYDSPPKTTTVTMTGGNVYGLAMYDSSALSFRGGYADYIVPRDSATVNMTGGGTYNIRAYNSSHVNFGGGSVTYLAAYDSSVVDITGGILTCISGYDSSVLNIYGQDFFVSNTGGYRGHGYVTGLWADGTSFNISLFNNPHIIGADTYPHVNLVAVPLPGSAILIFLGCGWMAHKLQRDRRRYM